MEIIASKSQIKIIIPTKGIDFDTFMEQINSIPVQFRNHLIEQIGISIESFYHKKREKKFKPLECQKLTEVTGVNPNN